MLIFLPLVIFFVGCAASEQNMVDEGAKPLSQAELESVFDGKRSGSFKSPRSSGTIVYHPDGKTEIDWGKGTDTGRYHISNGKFCAKWKKLRGGEERCFTVYQTGPDQYRFLNPDGSLNSDLTLQ
jgi:hypothetical protein